MNEATEHFVFTGTVDDKGHVKPDAVNATRGRLVKWKGKRVTVTVARYVKPKTNPQLGLYFREGGILDAWADFTGYDRDECHRELKLAFLAPALATSRLTGEEVKILPSLSEINAEEMSAFIDRILREGRTMGITFDLRETA